MLCVIIIEKNVKVVAGACCRRVVITV